MEDYDTAIFRPSRYQMAVRRQNKRVFYSPFRQGIPFLKTEPELWSYRKTSTRSLWYPSDRLSAEAWEAQAAFYSARNITAGSLREARHAGRAAAVNVISSKMHRGQPKLIGSFEGTAGSGRLRACPRITEPAKPDARPIAAMRNARLRMIA